MMGSTRNMLPGAPGGSQGPGAPYYPQIHHNFARNDSIDAIGSMRNSPYGVVGRGTSTTGVPP